MSDEIVKYDASVIMQGVKDKIKATFVSLIPDDKWDEMIQAEVDRFFKQEQYGDKKSEFQKMVEGCMNEMLKDKIKKLLEEKYVSNVWDNNQLKAGKEIEKIITDNAGKILVSLIGGISQQVINSMTAQRY